MPLVPGEGAHPGKGCHKWLVVAAGSQCLPDLPGRTGRASGSQPWCAGCTPHSVCRRCWELLTGTVAVHNSPKRPGPNHAPQPPWPPFPKDITSTLSHRCPQSPNPTGPQRDTSHVSCLLRSLGHSFSLPPYLPGHFLPWTQPPFPLIPARLAEAPAHPRLPSPVQGYLLPPPLSHG